MARTDADAVKEIMLPGRDYDLVNNPPLDRFIATASLVVDRMIVCAARKGITFTDAELENIEAWLAAHYYKRSDLAYASKATRDASATFQGKTDFGLKGTYYGQTALELDYSGCLNAISTGARAGASWLGKVPSEQTNYDERD